MPSLKIPLPENLTTGCELTARYTDDGNTLHLHRRSFAVEPKALRLDITSKIPEVLKPGAEVEMQFSVNRKEATDLVVSVYDQSLLGIAPDPGIDGASFFHADVRVEDGAVDSNAGKLPGRSVAERFARKTSDLSEQRPRTASVRRILSCSSCDH